MLSSGPGRYSSTSSGSSACWRAADRTRRIRVAAWTAWAALSARSTPWLALSETALTTHGKPVAAAARRTASSLACAGTISNRGWATPAPAHSCRCLVLSDAARTAPAGLCGSPKWAATEAASSSIGASAAMTASTGPQREAIRSAARPGSPGWTGMTGWPPTGSAPSLATVRSRPILVAASMKSAAR